MNNVQDFRHQCRTFSRLVLAADPPPGDVFGKDRPDPKAALDFVEKLLLCPTEDAARKLISQDRNAAEFCRIKGNDMASARDLGSALHVVQRPEHETPFYLLASLLLRRAELWVAEH